MLKRIKYQLGKLSKKAGLNFHIGWKNTFSTQFFIIKNTKIVNEALFNIEEPKDTEDLKEQLTKFDPPFVLVLKRKAIRLYPDSTRIALYYSDKLNKYFSVPYSTEENQRGVVQAEETIMSVLEFVRENKEPQIISYGENQDVTIEYPVADAILKVYASLNEENKLKISEMIEKGPEHFNKVASFALSKIK